MDSAPQHDAAWRDADLQLDVAVDRHAARRAVFGIEQRRQEDVALTQIEQVDDASRRERMHAARGAALLLDRAVAAADAVELVDGPQTDQVGDRLPLQDVGIDLDLVTSDFVGRLAPVGKDEACGEALEIGRASCRERVFGYV